MSEFRKGYIFKFFTSFIAIVIIILSHYELSFSIIVVVLIIEEIIRSIAEAIIFVSLYAFFTRIAEDNIGGTFVSFCKGLHLFAIGLPVSLGLIVSSFLNQYVGIVLGYIYIIMYFYLVIEKNIYL